MATASNGNADANHWSHDQFSHLHGVLLAAGDPANATSSSSSSTQASQQLLQRLQSALFRCKGDVLHLFAEPKQDAACRRELQEGTFAIVVRIWVGIQLA
jgi:hypothetical protein